MSETQSHNSTGGTCAECVPGPALPASHPAAASPRALEVAGGRWGRWGLRSRGQELVKSKTASELRPSVSVYAPLSHLTSPIKHKFKNKMTENFKMAVTGHSAASRGFSRAQGPAQLHWIQPCLHAQELIVESPPGPLGSALVFCGGTRPDTT